MLDVAIAYRRYQFLGNEFLTWLWFMIETDQNLLRQYDPDLLSLNIGSRLVLENTRNNAKETVTIKGDEANLEEGRVALKKGAVVIDVGITRVADATKKSGFSIKGDVDFENVAPKCSYITPVPGGVGLMTIGALMMNTYASAVAKF